MRRGLGQSRLLVMTLGRPGLGTGSPGGRKRVGENGPASLVPRRGPKVSDQRGAGSSLGEASGQIQVLPLAFSHSGP